MNTQKSILQPVFIFQLILAVVMCGSVMLKALESTQGVSLSMQIILMGYLFLHFLLALGAYRKHPDIPSLQAMWIYTTYAILTGGVIIIYLASDYHWADNDTVTMSIAWIMGFAILCSGMISNIPMTDPMPQSLLAIAFKAFPQWMMAWKIWEEGGAGIPLIVIILGNLSIILRIRTLILAIKQDRTDRNRRWLLVSETFNELSWVTITVIWFIR